MSTFKDREVQIPLELARDQLVFIERQLAQHDLKSSGIVAGARILIERLLEVNAWRNRVRPALPSHVALGRQGARPALRRRG